MAGFLASKMDIGGRCYTPTMEMRTVFFENGNGGMLHTNHAFFTAACQDVSFCTKLCYTPNKTTQLYTLGGTMLIPAPEQKPTTVTDRTLGLQAEKGGMVDFKLKLSSDLRELRGDSLISKELF